jgi:hypothetical protein
MASRLIEAGCDDALVVSRNGIVKVTFERSAASFAKAVHSAIANVGAAGYKIARITVPGSVLLEVGASSLLSRPQVQLRSNTGVITQRNASTRGSDQTRDQLGGRVWASQVA